jgi:hypothetical protein
MELQDIFNKAHKHFAGMTEPSMGGLDGDDENPQCAYRGDDGNKCIVGAFIPDSLYDGSLEGGSLDESRVQDVLALAFGQKKLTDDQYMLLGNLQSVHDRNADDWRDGFQCNSDVSWYEFIKYEMINCGESFDLETNKV